MKFKQSMLILGTLVSLGARAEDQGYRWDKDHNKCVNADNKEGRNPDVLGECGQVDKKTYGEELNGQNFKGLAINDSDVKNTRIQRADLTGIQAKNTNFDNTSFTGTNLMYAYFEGSSLQGADLSRIRFDGAQFKNTDLSYAKLSRATMNGNGFANSYLDHADLQDAYMVGAQFAAASLNDALLCGTDLSHAQVVQTSFRGAIYDSSTRLPFDEQKAQKYGMVKGNCR